MTDKHLLYWLFAAGAFGNLSTQEIQIALDTINAPEWVYPAYCNALEDYKDANKGDKMNEQIGEVIAWRWKTDEGVMVTVAAPTREQGDKTMLLIRAAPDMLEALKDALNETHYWRDKAMAAIAKATGG